LARTKSDILITQSLIDRLADVEQWPETRAASTAASVLNFGLPDIHSFDGSAGKEQNALTASLEKCIRTFEPRINHPRVFLARSDMLSRSLRFHIEGQVFYENMDEEIKFDTVLELISGEYEVK
jgi:type VI secretion system protein ImpF